MFIYLQESKRYINLATIAYTQDSENDLYLTVYFNAGTIGTGTLYQVIRGSDADYLRKRLAGEADNWVVEKHDDREDVLEESPF